MFLCTNVYHSLKYNVIFPNKPDSNTKVYRYEFNNSTGKYVSIVFTVSKRRTKNNEARTWSLILYPSSHCTVILFQIDIFPIKPNVFVLWYSSRINHFVRKYLTSKQRNRAAHFNRSGISKKNERIFSKVALTTRPAIFRRGALIHTTIVIFIILSKYRATIIRLRFDRFHIVETTNEKRSTLSEPTYLKQPPSWRNDIAHVTSRTVRVRK